MSDYDPSELIALCEGILEDGEISGEELYELAEWLNDHRDACLNWPGTLLVGPLQEVWSDGKSNKTEMRKIGRLLIQIGKEWAKRQAAVVFQEARNAAVEVAHTMDLMLPQLPSIPFVLRIKSHSEQGVFYDVDLTEPTCNCPDWRSWRQDLPPLHLSRCCKHVFSAYNQLEPEGGWPGWLGAILDLSWPPHPLQDWLILRVNGQLALVSTAPTGWGNVYVEEGGDYDRFGYNVMEDRWAYGIEPPGSNQIRRAILNASIRSR